MADALRLPIAPPRARPRRVPLAAQMDFYFPQEIDNSRLVKYADPNERRSQTRLVLYSLLVSLLVLTAASQRFATIQAGYRLEHLKQQREQFLEANRQLRLEEASLRDPGRIDAIARNQLGLVTPAPGQVARLDQAGSEADGAVIARVQAPHVSRALSPELGTPAP